jgi:hypothetical protein
MRHAIAREAVAGSGGDGEIDILPQTPVGQR